MLKYLPKPTPKMSDFLINSGTTLSKDGVNSTICTYGVYTFSTRRDGTKINGFIRDKFIYMFTAEKRRKKVVRYRSNKPNTLGERKVFTHSCIINKPHWTFSVYKFPLDMVHTAVQHSRWFEITLK